MTDNPEPLDLAGILEDGGPQRVARLEIGRMDLKRLGVGEMLELSRACELGPGELGAAMRGDDRTLKARVAVGLAWIIARRREPALTLADVQTWRLELVGTEPDPTPPLETPSSSGSEPTGSSESPG